VTPALVVFEDSRWRELRPLTDLVPVPALAFGASNLATRLERATRLPLRAIVARPEALAAWAGSRRPDPAAERAGRIVALNAAALPGPWLERVLADSTPAVFRAEGVVVAVRIEAERIAPALGGTTPLDTVIEGLALPAEAIDVERIARPWDLIARNADAIGGDLASLPPALEGAVHPGAVLLAPERIAVRARARVDPCAVLDGRGGPILIEPGAIVLPHTVVIGPCVVGAGTQLLGGFVGRTTFGPECRVAGEVEECIWQGYGNKRHHGFVGHSIVGEWVNFGALTTTSDLKNNYGPVRVWVDGREIDSGQSKIGSLVGAHVKTGIGTLLPTGASLGVGSNLFGGGRFVPKDVPPFSWWDGARLEDHRIDAFLGTARIAMSRRGRELGAADERILRGLWTRSVAERERFRAGSRSAPGA
jgi:UDP-N-acetylglucosamine diphosphorylase/glucosamine-1-phosphate N-acetyltransferase